MFSSQLEANRMCLVMVQVRHERDVDIIHETKTKHVWFLKGVTGWPPLAVDVFFVKFCHSCHSLFCGVGVLVSFCSSEHTRRSQRHRWPFWQEGLHTWVHLAPALCTRIRFHILPCVFSNEQCTFMTQKNEIDQPSLCEG